MRIVPQISIVILILVLLLTGRPATASEPIKCYETAWGTDEKVGLGLTLGLAVELCSGATDANKVIACFIKAWAAPDDGGLGLSLGQAVRLCKTNSLPS